MFRRATASVIEVASNEWMVTGESVVQDGDPLRSGLILCSHAQPAVEFIGGPGRKTWAVAALASKVRQIGGVDACLYAGKGAVSK